MNDISTLNDEITTLTNKLKNEQPNVYKLLKENPKTLPTTDNSSMQEELLEYKNHLNQLINNNIKQEKMKTHRKLGFDNEETDEVVKGLNELLANLHIHYQKLRNYHWNITGHDFFELHEVFEQEYNAVKLEIDEIAERIRVFDRTPMSTMKEYLATAEIQETGTDLTSSEMVEEILNDFETLLSFMVESIEAADEIGDIATNDLITGFMKRTEKMHWMLTSFNKS